MNLSETKINHEYIIDKINIDKCTSIRLQILGVLKGTHILVINKMKSGAIILKVRGTRLGIDKEVVNSITCISVENKGEKNEKSKYSVYRKS